MVKENTDFRNDLLLRYLSNEQVQENNDEFNKFYDEKFEGYIFGLTQKKDVRVEELKLGKEILSYKSSITAKINM